MTEQMTDGEMIAMQEVAGELADRMMEVAVNSTFGEIVLAAVDIIIIGLSVGDTVDDRAHALQSTINIMRSKFEMMESKRVQL